MFQRILSGLALNVFVLFIGLSVVVLGSGLLYTLIYYDVENVPADAIPIVPVFIGSLYGLAMYGLHCMMTSPKKKKPYNYMMLFMGFIVIMISYVSLELLYHKMYGR